MRICEFQKFLHSLPLAIKGRRWERKGGQRMGGEGKRWEGKAREGRAR
jgi:hypothetical protein